MAHNHVQIQSSQQVRFGGAQESRNAIGRRHTIKHDFEFLVGPLCRQVSDQPQYTLRKPIDVPTAMYRHGIRDLRARLGDRVSFVKKG